MSGRAHRMTAAWVLVGALLVTGPIPSAGAQVLLSPGDDIQSAVDAHPPGTVFHLAAGTYWNQTVVPKDGQTFAGQGAATVLTGARVLTGWKKRRSNQWYVAGQTQEGQVHGQCEGGWSRCNRPEDLFVDGVTYRHVSSRGQLGPGAWFFDYGADRIYIGEDPAGKLIETSVTRHAFLGDATGVTIKDMVIEKYAVPAQHGAIDSRTSNIGSHGFDWTVDGVEGRLNHGGAVYLSSGGSLVGSYLHHNGQQAISATGTGLLVENNEFSHNNTAHFNLDWEGGTSKFWNTTDLVFRGNHSHDNYGTGVWADYENINTLIEDNIIGWNYREGIYIEISRSATVRNNHVEGNGLDDPRGDSWLWSGGITVASSGNVEITGNTLVNNGNGITATQQNRGSSSNGPWLVENLNVHGNDVTMLEGQTGIVQDVGDHAVFLSRNNRFENNTYRGDGTALLFAWMDTSHTFVEWRTQFDLDWDGRFISSTGDTDAPVITLLGDDPLMLAVGDPFIDPGATATDNFDPRGTVYTTDPIDTSAEGTHAVSYRATDSAGNEAQPVWRTVIVGDPGRPVVTVVAGADAAELDSSPGHFTVTRTGDTSAALDVSFSLSGTADPGVDYLEPSSPVEIPAGAASADVVITPIDDTTLEPTETVTLAIDPDPGYETGTPASATIDITDDDAQDEFVAVGERAVKGGELIGTYLDTHVSDDVREVLTEEVYGGGKRSRLEHRWTFDVGSGPAAMFLVEAHRSGGVDAFRFEFSPDGAGWTTLLTVTDTADPGVPLVAPIPTGATGTVFVRVVDTDRSRNEGTADTLHIDRMAITSG